MKTKDFESTDKEGNEVALSFKKPNQSVLSRGDFVYRAEFSKAIRAGIMTSAEATKLLSDRDIWNKDSEVAEADLRKEILELEQSLEDKQYDEASIQTFDKIKDLRIKLNELTQVYSSISDNTAESVASEIRTQFFASECSVYKASGKKVFKNHEDFKSRLDETITVDCYRHALISNWEEVLGIEINSLSDKLPEDEWMSKENPKEETQEKVVEEEVEVPEVEKPKRKRKRKKKVSTT